MEYLVLDNGIKMPQMGYGVYQIAPNECQRCVMDAIDVGYRLIDTAQSYGNEEQVGAAIAKCGVPRNELFLVTKIWISNSGYERAKASIDESLKKLKTDYVDLLLIHQPFGDYYGTYRAMEEAYGQNKVRAIGVSNFYPDRLVDLVHFSSIPPMVNQIEMHPFQQQKKAKEYMDKYHVQLMSWGPFAEGRNKIFTNETLVQLANKYKKTVAQIILRFLIQSNAVIIPKSSHKERMEENINIFDFVLLKEDMEKIRALDTAQSLFFSHYDPQTVEMILNLKR